MVPGNILCIIIWIFPQGQYSLVHDFVLSPVQLNKKPNLHDCRGEEHEFVREQACMNEHRYAKAGMD